MLRFLSEFVEGFDALDDQGPAVTCFGSARIPRSDPIYAQGVALGRALAERQVAVITGGGPGLMEAVNRGAQEAGGRSIGCNIELPHERRSTTTSRSASSSATSSCARSCSSRTRKDSSILPGGFGTLDELFEALTLAQTGKIDPFPIVLLGSSYWAGLLAWLRSEALPRGVVSERDLSLLRLTDDPDEAAALATAPPPGAD